MDAKVYAHTSLGPAHEAILALVGHGSYVLEVGCAGGHMTEALSKRLGCRVTAVEINADEAEKARPFAESVVTGDITDPGVWPGLPPGFDHVLYADVLEHLADPWEVLRRTRSVLKPEGSVIASIPNIAYYKIRKQLLLGRFDYTRFGIMDDSHLRFFTEKTTRAMFESTGYEVTGLGRVFRGRTDRCLCRLCPNAFTYQFVIEAIPASGRQ